MRNFLAEVTQHKREEVELKKARRPLDSFKSEVKHGSARFLQALADDGLKIIAEIKPRSPSLGQLEGNVDPAARLDVYQNNAQAISVLCDQKYFGGSVELLAEISAQLTLPTLLKDFVIDPYQIYEGRHAGAEAVLLIVKILKKQELIELNALVQELGMIALVEVQTEEEMETARCIGPELLLINNRDLESLQMDLSTVERLVTKLDYSTRVVAASGIENADHMMAMRPFASRFLIGSALMSSGNPQEKFDEFRKAEAEFLQGARSKS